MTLLLAVTSTHNVRYQCTYCRVSKISWAYIGFDADGHIDTSLIICLDCADKFRPKDMCYMFSNKYYEYIVYCYDAATRLVGLAETEADRKQLLQSNICRKI